MPRQRRSTPTGAPSPGRRPCVDAGYGVGRDALTFAGRGYSVLAFDTSAEMVRLARERVGGRAEVVHMRFEDVAWREEFEGVWACASLLHVPAAELPAVIGRLAAALRAGSARYMSFKYGSGERVANGRRFTDLDEDGLRSALEGTGLTLLEVWTTTDMRVQRSDQWLNAVTLSPGVRIHCHPSRRPRGQVPERHMRPFRTVLPGAAGRSRASTATGITRRSGIRP